MRKASVLLRYVTFAVTSAHANGQGVAFSCHVNSVSKESDIPPCEHNYVSKPNHDGMMELRCDDFYPKLTYTKCDFGDENGLMKDGIFTAPSSGIYVFNLDARFEIFDRKFEDWMKKDWYHKLLIELVKNNGKEVEVIDHKTLFSSSEDYRVDSSDWQNSGTDEISYKTDCTLILKRGDQVYVRWYMQEGTGKWWNNKGTSVQTNARTEAYNLCKKQHS